MSILSKLFGGGHSSPSPMDEANKYLNQIPSVGHKGLDPYINSGLDASTKTKNQFEQLMSNPVAFINKIMEGYKPSQGYQLQKDLLGKEMSNTAAAGGIAGTPIDQLNQADAIQGLLGKDMQQFLTNALGIYKTGLEGEEGIGDRGYDASKNLMELLANALNQKGGLAFQNQQQKDKDKNDLWHMFGKALGAGVGGLTAGLPGAYVGSQIGG